MKVDYIIVGQGLAGSLLAFELIQHKKKILIVDQGYENSASNVAAGLINPIIGKRLVLRPDYDKYLSSAKKTYQKIEQKLSEQIYSPKNIVRVFKDAKELELWNAKRETLENLRFIKNYNPAGLYANHIRDDYGSLAYEGALCNTQNLLRSLREYFHELDIIVNSSFRYDDLDISSGKIKWNNYTADKIIFCEGYHAIHNPWFKNLPFKNAQGEILTLKLKNPGFPDFIFISGKWIIPINEKILKAGANYQWDNIDCNPNEVGKDEILNAIKKFLKADFDVIDHTTGVRPVLIDLNPVLGLHPENTQIGLFNGLGSKGILVAPFFATHLANHLVKHTPLDSQVNIARFMEFLH